MGKDKNFMEDYLEGRDVYMMLARQYKPGVDDETLKKKYRKKCKSLILGLHYGKQPCHSKILLIAGKPTFSGQSAA